MFISKNYTIYKKKSWSDVHVNASTICIVCEFEMRMIYHKAKAVKWLKPDDKLVKYLQTF